MYVYIHIYIDIYIYIHLKTRSLPHREQAVSLYKDKPVNYTEGK